MHTENIDTRMDHQREDPPDPKKQKKPQRNHAKQL